MEAARVIADGLRGGDLLWSLPLVTALGLDGRRASVRWVERCLYRMVDLAGLDSQFGGIHDRIADSSAAPAAANIGEVLAATERAGLRGDPVADAIAMLHVAHWQAARRDDNQFAVSQESAFERMRAFLSATEWEQVAGLAAEEFRAALASAPDAAPGTSSES